MGNLKPNWIRTDPAADMINSLEHCLLCVPLAHADRRNWKWCVNAAHSAAQMAMVRRLRSAGQEREWNEKSRKELLLYYRERRTDPSISYPDLRLARFMDIYHACTQHLPADDTTPTRRERIADLNSLRNNWTHFAVDGWSVSIGLARKCTLAGIELVATLFPHRRDGPSDPYDHVMRSLFDQLSINEHDTTLRSESVDELQEKLLALYADDD